MRHEEKIDLGRGRCRGEEEKRSNEDVGEEHDKIIDVEPRFTFGAILRHSLCTKMYSLA